MQTTNNFTDFTRTVSNYDTDIFSPIFAELERQSGKKYKSTLPSAEPTEQEKVDVAFRVIGDHIRTLSFSIADGIQPGNTDRNYVLRRILRRAVKYGRTLGFKEPFFYKLVDVLVRSMGNVFPELTQRQSLVQEVIRNEEQSFNKTLDRGIELFREEAKKLRGKKELTGDFAFKLYDTYGFPLDLTQLMAREAGLLVDASGFEKLMSEQRDRARSAQKKEIISVSTLATEAKTEFVGFDVDATKSKVIEVLKDEKQTAVVLDRSPFYAEMGGQLGDTGVLISGDQEITVSDTQKVGDAFLHVIKGDAVPAEGSEVELRIDVIRRAAIQRHHTVTHLFHWALHEVTSPDATQKGSFVGPEKLTFDFNSQPLTSQQLCDIEQLVNERILENTNVSWAELNYSDIASRDDILQFFGDKYGDKVRIVQIGGQPNVLDGYSMELCGGTHVSFTGEIGLFRIQSESAVAAGVRRIEAIAGLVASRQARSDAERIFAIAEQLNSPVRDLEKKIISSLEQTKKLEKELKALQQSQAASQAKDLLGKIQVVNGINLITANLGSLEGNQVQSIVDALKAEFNGVIVLGAGEGGRVALVANVSKDLTDRIQAGKIIQHIAPIVGGKGGGNPSQARGGGKDTLKIDEALSQVIELI